MLAPDLSHLDWSAVRAGVIAGAVVILPSTIATSLLIDSDDSSGWIALFGFLTLIGFLLAGFAAGRRRSDTPMIHGAVAAFLTWAIIQTIGVIRRLTAGESIAWFTLVVAALFAVSFGVAGAVLADWDRRRRLRG